mgnify:CR=1 FL=1
MKILVKVKPNAKTTRVEYCVFVTEPLVDGKANRAVINTLTSLLIR